MRLRLAFILLAFALGSGSWGPAIAAQLDQVRVGVLKFGTVNWELDVIRRHGLDKKHGIQLVLVELAGKDATAIGLQGGAVDAIVTDWIWVSRQRHGGGDFTFVPHSAATGGIYARPDSGITRLADLEGKKLGVAGGPLDKSWLLLRAYGHRALGRDMANIAEPVFAAPPLLNELMLTRQVPALLNFWHYNARLEAAGMRPLLSVREMLQGLGLPADTALIGWVFRQSWAAENSAAGGLLRASLEAKRLLAESDAEWERLRPLMKAENDEVFRALRDAYRTGIVSRYDPNDIAAAEKIFSLLAAFGGAELVGKARSIAPGTFWPGIEF